MTDVNIIMILCFFVGLLSGWFVTFSHYRAKERERKAVEAYKARQFVKNAPPTYHEQVLDLIAKLNDSIVDEYHIVVDGIIYELRKIEKPDEK